MGLIMSSIWSWFCGKTEEIGSKKRNSVRESPKHELFFSINVNDNPSPTNTTTTFRQNNITSNTPAIRHANSNQRSVETTTCRRIGAYNSCQRILLVGEGDFSFSTSLARAFVFASNMVSTSLDSFEFLKENYCWSMKNVAELKGRGCTVLHDISATELANHPVLGTTKFDRIIFNFPLAGFFGRNVPRDIQIGMNQALVYLFMGNAKKMIEEDGEIHITDKAYGFFRQWNLQQLGCSQGLQLTEEVNFDRTLYPGYHTKYGFGGNKNFDCHNSKTYKFKLMINCTP